MKREVHYQRNEIQKEIDKIDKIISAFTEIPEHIFCQFSGHLMIKDSKSQYIASKKNFSELWSFNSIDEVIGIYDDNLKCEASLFAKNFRQQDKKAREKI